MSESTYRPDPSGRGGFWLTDKRVPTPPPPPEPPRPRFIPCGALDPESDRNNLVFCRREPDHKGKHGWEYCKVNDPSWDHTCERRRHHKGKHRETLEWDSR